MVCLGLLTAVAPAAAQGGAGEETPGIEEPPNVGANMGLSEPYTPFAVLADEALSEHPALERRRALVEVEREKKSGVGLRPDPMITLGVEAIPWNDPGLSSSPMSGIQLGVAQPLWWPGELAAMKEEVESRAEALVALVDEQQVGLIIQAAGLYYEVYEIDRTIEALVELKEPFEEFLRLLRSRLPTGKASVAQVERVRLQLLRIDDQLFLLRHNRPVVIARLNAVLNRPAGSVVNPPAETVDGGLEADTDQPVGRLDQLVELGMRQRPVVEALERRKEVALAEARTAQYVRYPDLKVFGAWRFRAEQESGLDEGTDFVGAGISSTIPLWSDAKADAAEDVAQSKIIGLDAAIAEFRLDLRGKLASRLARLHHFLKHARYYRDTVIPQAEQARQAALAGFQAGRAAYEDWIQAEEEIVRLKTQLVEYEAGVRKQRALTLALIGQVNTNETPVTGQENSDDE
jgi:outer membrane protein TolC